MSETLIREKPITRESRLSNIAWQEGYEWVMKNYHIDSRGFANCSGDFLKHFSHLENISSVPEGVRWGLYELDEKIKSGLL